MNLQRIRDALPTLPSFGGKSAPKTGTLAGKPVVVETAQKGLFARVASAVRAFFSTLVATRSFSQAREAAKIAFRAVPISVEKPSNFKRNVLIGVAVVATAAIAGAYLYNPVAVRAVASAATVAAKSAAATVAAGFAAVTEYFTGPGECPLFESTLRSPSNIHAFLGQSTEAMAPTVGIFAQ